MSITIYFAKLNLISQDLYNLYDNPKIRDDLAASLYSAIHVGPVWEKESFFRGDDGEFHATTIEYSITILRLDNNYQYAEGWLYKKSKLHYKTLDTSTKQLVPKSIESTEGNRFTIDFDHGYVGYNTSNRFGYKEFIEAFSSLVNLGEQIIL